MPNVTIDIDRIQPDPENVRSKVSVKEVEHLAQSIKGIGLQQPLRIRPFEGAYRIISGHRRYAAIQILKDAGDHTGSLVEGKDVIIETADLSDSDVLVAQLVENLQREDIDVLDEAAGYMRLLEFGMSQADISRKVGRNRSHVTKRLALLTLPNEAKTRLTKGEITIEFALGVAALDSEDRDLFVQEGQWTDYALSRYLRRAKARKTVAKFTSDLATVAGLELREDTGDIHTQPVDEGMQWQTVEVLYSGTWDGTTDAEATMGIVRQSGDEAVAHLYKMVPVTEKDDASAAEKREAKRVEREKEKKRQERALERAKDDFLTAQLVKVKAADANDFAMTLALGTVSWGNAREACKYLDLEVPVKVTTTYDGKDRNEKQYFPAWEAFIREARENGDIGNLRRAVMAAAAIYARQAVLDHFGFDPEARTDEDIA